MRRFYSQLQQMPQSCHCSRLGYLHWPRLDLGVTCPSVQPIRVGLRSRPVMARSQSGCPTGRPLMRLLSRRRGRLWRYAYAVSASPASGGPATTGFHPASSEKPERPCACGKAAFGRPLHFRLKRRNGRKKRAPRRQPNFGDKLVTLMEYEAVWNMKRSGPHTERVLVVSGPLHDAAGLDGGGARSAASPRLGGAGADPGESAGHGDFSRADDFSRAGGQSDERAGLDPRPREPVHAHAGVAAYGRS